jgi:glycosyltransferase involved in cell wall biosynthesis
MPRFAGTRDGLETGNLDAMADRPRISVCVLACDEADKIAHALNSAKRFDWCDELLVFDSGSTDDTVAIAESIADRVEHHDWVDFTTNRRKLIDAASNDWVLILDADEQISDALGQQIAALPADVYRGHPVITMPRRNYLLGRHVKAWDPDRVARLIDRKRVIWPERAIHDRPRPTDGDTYDLSGPIEHNRHSADFGDYFDGERYQRRTEALAAEMYEGGRRVGWLGLAMRPWFAFIKFYLLKGGFLQGSFGLLVAQKAAVSVQLKYARLWWLQQRRS